MSIIKSLSVGNGDMFYIKHSSDNFTIIDCCMSEVQQEDIVNELIMESAGKNIKRFISTHPDEDHIRGLKYLDDNMGILNFYCVKNQATKDPIFDDFRRYCTLRDSEKAFYLSAGCTRKWMNEKTDERGSSGINIYWPKLTNAYYLEALEEAKRGDNPNNISPIFTYHLSNGPCVMWMGDLETDLMEKIADSLNLPKANILFAPHHGRDSGKVPESLLKSIDPDLIVIGEANSEHLNYYSGYDTITQNSAENIIFDCNEKKVHVYVSNVSYEVDCLDYESVMGIEEHYYIGTLNV